MVRISTRIDGWEVCDGNRCEDRELKSVPVYFEALHLLRGLKEDPLLMRSARELSARLGSVLVGRMSDQRVMERIALSLSRGRLHLCRSPQPDYWGTTVTTDSETAKPKKAEDEFDQSAVRPRKTWVEFAVVDMEGNPAAGQHYIVMLPDGSIHDGSLDKTGRVRFNGIDPENSVFTLPDLDQDMWERFH